MATAEVRRKSDDAPLPAKDLSVTTDNDSFCWQLNATILDPDMARSVAPTSAGMSEVKAIIQGWRWDFIVEGYSVRREHGRITYTLKGRSRTAYLAAPHAPERARIEVDSLDMQQLAAEELTNTGFTLDWQAPDWNVPVGTLYYKSRTPIQAISHIAEAAGAFVASARAADALTVLPYYPTSPPGWSTSGLPTVEEGEILRAQERWQNDERHSRVWVTGEEASGVIVECYRPAWDVLDETREAAPQSHRLITDAQAGRALGTYIIDRSGPKLLASLTTAFPRKSEDTNGLKTPGTMVATSRSGTTEPGVVTATRVSARIQGEAPTATQEIEVELRPEEPE